MSGFHKEPVNEGGCDRAPFFRRQAKRLTAWCLLRHEALYGA